MSVCVGVCGCVCVCYVLSFIHNDMFLTRFTFMLVIIVYMIMDGLVTILRISFCTTSSSSLLFFHSCSSIPVLLFLFFHSCPPILKWRCLSLLLYTIHSAFGVPYGRTHVHHAVYIWDSVYLMIIAIYHTLLIIACGLV